MDSMTLLDEARRAGLRVWAEGNQLKIEGHPSLERLAQRVLAEKPSILAALAADDPDVALRVRVMQAVLVPGKPIPVLTVLDRDPASGGRCLSCGRALPKHRTYRCDLCSYAAWLVAARTTPQISGKEEKG